jgi:sugar phosphate isomerase/epimerase
MYLTGFADEAAPDLEGQIRATRALGWKYIEARNVGGKNLHDLDEAEFDRLCAALEREGLEINCFGSAIANWGKRIDQPVDSSLAEARRAIPRMKRLGTRLVRIMSFAVLDGRAPSDQMKEERFRRLRELCGMFRAEGLTPVHENCMNYGGMGYPFTLELVENVPGLALVFDTGNPVFSDDRSKPEPYPKQDGWEFYRRVKPHVVYVHIKDGVWDPVAKQMTYTFPGEGQAEVRRIVQDLLASGYEGGFSMEPHMKVVFHEEQRGEVDAEARLSLYVEYGRRFERLLAELGAPAPGARVSP